MVANVPFACSHCRIIIQITTAAVYTQSRVFTRICFCKYSTTALEIHRWYKLMASALGRSITET